MTAQQIMETNEQVVITVPKEDRAKATGALFQSNFSFSKISEEKYILSREACDMLDKSGISWS